MELSVVLEPHTTSETQGYTAYIPNLPGCIAEGKTKEEALQNFREALALFLELDEDEVPKNRNGILIEKIQV